MFCIFMHMSHTYASPAAGQLVVVKYGGNAMPGEGPDPVLAEVAAMHTDGTGVVLVHGGGPEIDRALAQRGVETRRIDGLRVTDATTLDVTEAVLCGTLNKRIVRALLHLGAPAAGISGQDGGTLVAEFERSAIADLGFVGRIVTADGRLVRALLGAGFLPVVAPLAVAAGGEHALNVNADLSAAALASALGADAFVSVTNVSRVFRVLGDPATAIERLSLDGATAFAHSEACQSSMKPKLHAAVAAVARGATASYICAARPNAIRDALAGDATIVA